MQPPEKITPMMAQFNAVKEQFPDTLLFFRMGDFYEMFGTDAEIGAKVLGIALTSRDKRSANPMPMCGVPHHACKQYAVRLVKAGYNVAVCEQLEDPAQAKGIVKRGVTRVISPATMIDDEELTGLENNFMLAVYNDRDVYYIAAADISTGEVYLASTNENNLENIISSFVPKEILSSVPLSGDRYVVTRQAKSAQEAVNTVLRMYKGVKDTAQLGIDDIQMLVPVEMIFSYVSDRMLSVQFARPAVMADEGRLVLDSIAVRTLELVEASEKSLSLFNVINYTKTAMGGRMLYRWVLSPSRNLAEIERRHSIVGYFADDWRIGRSIQELLKEVFDIERIANRAASGRVLPKDLISLKNSLEELPRIGDILEGTGVSEIAILGKGFNSCGELAELIGQAITDNPQNVITAGGIIRDGFNRKVDELRAISKDSSSMLLAEEARLKSATGINQLKVEYNKVFGYYIEVSKSNISKVPGWFERKQTLVNCERYITPEIKELENTILNAEDNLCQLEYEIYTSIRQQVAEEVELLRSAAKSIAELDTLLSLANAAVIRGYVRPTMDESRVMDVKDARHPTVEVSSRELFMANDIMMDGVDNRLLIITGPNMSGKSTYIRSAALIAVMAHIGSFVPAAEARIGLIDRVFTRVGASDNIGYGQSTFMVEMVETANILTHATDKSLIILDEIGRGTSTYDGLSIAWAVSEYIISRLGAKTLFATHYHELTEIADMMHGAKNLSVQVKEEPDEVIFMHRIIPGPSDKSYGIYVAQLAGLPEEVIRRANNVLAELEEQGASQQLPVRKNMNKLPVVKEQILIFDEEHPVVEKLRNIDINNLTPIEAIKTLHELKKDAEAGYGGTGK